MLGRIVKGERPIEMRPASLHISLTEQGNTYEAMPDHERHGRSLLFGKRQELPRQLAQSIAVECQVIHNREPVED
jgi:hypothetical protein